MGLFWSQYCKALAATAIAMAAYCLTVVPWIEPKEKKVHRIPKDVSPQVTNRWWQSLFEKDDWQVQQKTIDAQNPRGVLLAQSWEQNSPRSWKMTPLTIILAKEPSEELSDEATAQDVWIISAQEATIHFDEAFDLRSGTMPSLQKGQLTGEILIRQVNTGDPTAQQWQLRTRDVNIDRRRIWTQQEVQIDFDSSRIRGYDLRINLLSDILSKRSNLSEDNSASKFGPLDEIELMHLTELAITLRPGGIWANANPDLLQVAQPVQNLPARMEATCGGRFTFNFSKETASLTGGVHVKHFLGGLPPDEFLCHRVNIRLRTDQDIAGSTAKSSQAAGISGVAIRDIDAFGIDSLEEFVGEKWVEFKSPVIGATARAKRMHVDLGKQGIELAGKLDQPGATHSIAELNYRGYRFQAPSLEYRAAPKGTDGKAVHAGWLAAQGAGELSSPPDSRLGEAYVRWQDSFVWAPTEKPSEQKIVLMGQTLVEQKQQGFMTADLLQIWLTQLPGASGASAIKGFQPKRVLSQGQSTIATNRAQVHVNNLDVEFVYPPTASDDPSAPDASGATNALGQFVSQPVLGASSQAPTQDASVEINGQSLVAKVAAVGRRLWIEAMTIYGPLNLKSTKVGQSAPWNVDGSALNLASTPSGDLDIEIEGQPAVVNFADGSIQGPRIGFNQLQNRVWMDQPGEFTLPAEIKSADGQAMKWIKPLRCTWEKRMVFDGDRIRFEGNIEMLGTLQQLDGLWFVKGNCQELDLQLSQPINFEQVGKLKQLQESSELQQIILRQNVDLLVTRKDNQGNRISRGRLVVPTTLNILVPQQKIVAAGPGRGFTNFVNSSSQISGPSSTNSLSGGASGLSSVSFTYRDSLVVYLDRKEVVVDGNVKVLASPINSWDDEIGPDITRLNKDQFACNSDQIKLYDTASLHSTQSLQASQGLPLKSAQWEVQATGNVRFDGNAESGEYSGNAYQVVYVQAKDQLFVAGDGRSKAVIRKLASLSTAQVEPSITYKLDKGLFNVKSRGIIDSQGVEVHYESPSIPGQTQPPNPSLFPNVPGSALPGNKPVQPRGTQEDPRNRGINRLLQGYGS